MADKLSARMQKTLARLHQHGPFEYNPQASASFNITVQALVRRGLVNVNPVYASNFWRVTPVAESDTPAGRAALAAETPVPAAPADRPYDPDNITGQDDYEFALAWEKQQQARAETPAPVAPDEPSRAELIAPTTQPVEPTRQQKLAEAYTLLEKVIELIESAVEGTSQEPRAQSYIIPHLRDWLVNENCSLDNLMSEIENEYQGF